MELRRLWKPVAFSSTLLLFIALWAYASGESVTASPPTNLSVTNDSGNANFYSRHPFTVSTPTNTTFDSIWQHIAGTWHNKASAAFGYNVPAGNHTYSWTFSDGDWNPYSGSWTFFAFSDVSCGMAGADNANSIGFTWPL